MNIIGTKLCQYFIKEKHQKKGALVRSDVLAKMFGRTHKQVLATIKAKSKFLEENSISLGKYFLEEKATKPQGGSYSRYQLTRRGVIVFPTPPPIKFSLLYFKITKSHNIDN